MRPHEKQNLITGAGEVGPLSGEVSDPHNEILSGIWVTSYSGFVQAIPPIEDPEAPPVTGGYGWNQNAEKWEQREGHFITSALTYFVFDGNGNVSGVAQHNRGDTSQHKKFPITGTYEAYKSAIGLPQPVYWGWIFTKRLGGNPSNYYFVRKNRSELEWLSIPPFEPDPKPDPDNPRRPIIARGTLTKMTRLTWWDRFVQRFE